MMPAAMRRRQSQSGNMFIYIIGAIFLIGILVVMMRGGFQPGSGIDAEKTTLQVTQVKRFASDVERGVTAILTNGFSEADIRFANSQDSDYGTLSDNPARQVFAPEGGNVEYWTPPENIQTAPTPWVFNARSSVEGIGSTCNQAACTDLIMILPDVTKAFCLAVNDANKIENPSGNPPAEGSAWTVTSKFTGSASDFTYSTTLNSPNSNMEACLEGSETTAQFGLIGKYYYYRVLYPR